MSSIAARTGFEEGEQVVFSAIRHLRAVSPVARSFPLAGSVDAGSRPEVEFEFRIAAHGLSRLKCAKFTSADPAHARSLHFCFLG